MHYSYFKLRIEINKMSAVLVIIVIIVSILYMGIHRVSEGHIGLYWRGGRLIDGITEPGFHFMYPLITSYSEIQVSVQTDRVEEIPCGTSGGVMIYFDKIEVVNRLDKKYAWQTIKNYTINYDNTWIFDKIQ